MRTVILCLLLIAFANAGPQENIIRKIRQFITTFFTTSQLRKMFELTGGYNESSMTGMHTDMSSSFMKILTTEQFMKGMQLYREAMGTFGGSMNAIKSVGMRCFSGSMPVFLPVQARIKTVYNDARKAGQSMSAIRMTVLRAINKEFTRELVKQAMEGCKAGVGHENWEKIKTLLGNYVRFSAMGVH